MRSSKDKSETEGECGDGTESEGEEDSGEGGDCERGEDCEEEEDEWLTNAEGGLMVRRVGDMARWSTG
jgi:hypothetical protein